MARFATWFDVIRDLTYFKIFYPNDMTEGIEFMTCHDEEDDEDSKCSEAWSNFSIKDHLWFVAIRNQSVCFRLMKFTELGFRVYGS